MATAKQNRQKLLQLCHYFPCHGPAENSSFSVAAAARNAALIVNKFSSVRSWVNISHSDYNKGTSSCHTLDETNPKDKSFTPSCSIGYTIPFPRGD